MSTGSGVVNLDNFHLLSQGAEAKLYQGTFANRPTLVKERFVKQYRHPQLDETLTKERMKSEARTLVRCRTIGIPTPVLYLVHFPTRCIYMEYIPDSTTVKEYLRTSLGTDDVSGVFVRIGQTLAKMHCNRIIHGDLTTSNMLLKPPYAESPIVLIDFGLSSVSDSAEDKGVDLYVLERALISSHPNSEPMFEVLVNSYKQFNVKECTIVLKKFEEIRQRGRKRTMVG